VRALIATVQNAFGYLANPCTRIFKPKIAKVPDKFPEPLISDAREWLLQLVLGELRTFCKERRTMILTNKLLPVALIAALVGGRLELW
jgi:hypothetical protein